MKFVRNIILFIVLLTASGLKAQTCYGNYTWAVNGLTVSFSGTVSMNVNNITWYFGDSNYDISNQVGVQHTYAQAGTYTACIIVQDTVNNCFDSTCHTFTLGACQASFNYIDSLGYIFFINSSTLGSGGMYIWDFGDGNYDYTFSPSHSYGASGNYLVCLVAYDSLQNFCDSTCMTIVASSTNTAGISEDADAFGNVQFAPNPAQESVTLSFLFKEESEVNISLYDLTGRKVESFGQQNFQAGQQQQQLSISGVNSGTYLLRIEVNGRVMSRKLIIVGKHN